MGLRLIEHLDLWTGNDKSQCCQKIIIEMFLYMKNLIAKRIC